MTNPGYADSKLKDESELRKIFVVGTFDEFEDAVAAMDRDDCEYSVSNTPPYLLKAQKLSDAEVRS